MNKRYGYYPACNTSIFEKHVPIYNSKLINLNIFNKKKNPSKEWGLKNIYIF